MPFTPLHMGPGMAAKVVLGRHFSLVGFGVSQILIDLEPLIRMVRGDAVLHGPTHTYLGAIPIALLAMPLTRWLYPWLARLANFQLSAHRLAWLRVAPQAGWAPIIAGCLIGTLSHVLLDSFMHSDMHPLAPFAEGNAMLFVISLSSLHVGCMVAGALGLAVWVTLRFLGRQKATDPD
ncbi:MAG: DUF4184 family protein [Rhodanobacteraceae bacterium]|nr:DUF4184 family protein [Xanthomonadales bacterium]MCP5478809.1 DUF4184 family protein [Rhodanobacteraceae bacterium]HPF73413.1 DUF4184 family protein [Xanthomonadaceae bacterium]HRX99808.1 DUF4184 family protein [Xanthomonadaceae bacterium]